MKRNIIFAAALVLVGATTALAKSPVEERAAYWQKKLSRELPHGTSRQVVIRWLTKNQLEASEDSKTHGLTIKLELVSMPSPTSESTASPTVACSKRQIMALLSFYPADQLNFASVATFPGCL